MGIKTWSVIREIGMCNKPCDNHYAIDINDLNEKFTNIPSPVIPRNYYENCTPPFNIKNTFYFLPVSDKDTYSNSYK